MANDLFARATKLILVIVLKLGKMGTIVIIVTVAAMDGDFPRGRG